MFALGNSLLTKKDFSIFTINNCRLKKAFIALSTFWFCGLQYIHTINNFFQNYINYIITIYD